MPEWALRGVRLSGNVLFQVPLPTEEGAEGATEEDPGAALFAAARQYQQKMAIMGTHNKDGGASVKLGTKKRLMEKFPNLKIVIHRWAHWHEAERDDDNTVAFQDTWETSQKELQRCRVVFEESGLESRLPETVSVGWFCKMMKLYGVIDSCV